MLDSDGSLGIFRFVFLRHGQTDANAQGLMCGGDWDIPLNATGFDQARRAAETIVRSGISISSICASPMRRAQETAEIVATQLSKPIITIEELREWRVGEWEQRPWKEVPDPFLTEVDPEKGESRLEFERRVIRGARKSFSEAGPVLIVAHGGVWHALARPLKVDQGIIPNATPAVVELRLKGLEASWDISFP